MIFVADCPYWVNSIVPNLPHQYRDEYILRLAEFIPNVQMKKIERDFFKAGNLNRWVFPFIVDFEKDLSNFDWDRFDDFTVNVETEMMKKYSLKEHHFCS